MDRFLRTIIEPLAERGVVGARRRRGLADGLPNSEIQNWMTDYEQLLWSL